MMNLGVPAPAQLTPPAVFNHEHGLARKARTAPIRKGKVDSILLDSYGLNRELLTLLDLDNFYLRYVIRVERREDLQNGGSNKGDSAHVIKGSG